MITLGFDTSGAHCAATLLDGDRVLATRHEEMTKGQAERLFPLLDEMLAGADRSWQQIDRIGVGIGPGNFTGIRIAVSAARGLALSLDIPAIGVATFDALALDLPAGTFALVKAPQQKVYIQRVDPTNPGTPRLIQLDDLRSQDLPDGATWVGDHADHCAATLSGTAIAPRHALSDAIARIAATAAPSEPPAPLYLRPADAAPSRDTPPVIVP